MRTEAVAILPRFT